MTADYRVSNRLLTFAALLAAALCCTAVRAGETLPPGGETRQDRGPAGQRHAVYSLPVRPGGADRRPRQRRTARCNANGPDRKAGKPQGQSDRAGAARRPTATASSSSASPARRLSIPVKVTGQKEKYEVSFVRDVMPTLSRMGCNAGTCHGSAERQERLQTVAARLRSRPRPPLADRRPGGPPLQPRRSRRQPDAAQAVRRRAARRRRPVPARRSAI